MFTTRRSATVRINPAIFTFSIPTSARRAARRNTEIPVKDFVLPLFMKWLTMETRGPTGGASCRSTFQTAFTARPATSWILTRSLTGLLRRAGAVPTIRVCEDRECSVVVDERGFIFPHLD